MVLFQRMELGDGSELVHAMFRFNQLFAVLSQEDVWSTSPGRVRREICDSYGRSNSRLAGGHFWERNIEEFSQTSA